MLEYYQHGTVGMTVIVADNEESTKCPVIVVLRTSCDNDSPISPPVTSSAQHCKNTSLEAEHEEGREQL